MKKKINIKLIFAFLIFLLSLTYNFYIFKKKNKEYFTNNLNFEIKQSNILSNGERGLFANKDYKKDEIIEICPTLKMSYNEVSNSNILNNHFFEANNENDSLVSLGYCSIINHSDSKQNCTWDVSDDDNSIIMRAIKPIAKGEELYSNYGENYWKNKDFQKI